MAPKKRVPAAPDEGKPGPNKRVKPTAAATGVDAGSARDDQLQSLFGPRKRQLFRLLSEAVPSFAYDILTVVISYGEWTDGRTRRRARAISFRSR